MNQPVAVLIPMYKADMNELEQISFDQCVAVLGNHPIIIVKPASLQLSDIEAKHPNIGFRDFSDSYFDSIAGYNELLTSPGFYKAFLAFEHILIYQLDAFVFEDRLLEWCQKGYDYIGSPYIDPARWMVGGPDPGNYFQHRRVFLNGGFSLRNVRACMRFLQVFYFLGQKRNSNEDGFFSLHFIRLRPFAPLLRLPSWQEALAFGIEQHPRLCYELNGRQKPFGCHAWERYDYAFWKPFIQQ
jgi:hypothetical protein